ncbi:iron complex outermembrane recepter protein [Dyadobacter soli]|uniref:Iron complex outermembrane recepter protein n=1 Tax=Dyadobacter soli TaxID=659014 RepID=A0A1G7TXX0_9BACT|nr:iron complex outermembrane recepter protein [Dyadobacter soli]
MPLFTDGKAQDAKDEPGDLPEHLIGPFSEEKRKIDANHCDLKVFTDRRFVGYWVLWASFALTLPGYAQNDSIALETVVVRGFVPEKFMSGLKIQAIDSASLTQLRFQNISDVLSAFTPIAFRNYGPGQLSTASFRGTSANHTAVLWNGLNINAPTLGQTDFSTIPVAGFDQLSIQYGSAASIVGSDAVGGSILLGSKAPDKPLSVTAGAQRASFNNYQVQETFRYFTHLNEKWEFSGKTAVYNGKMNNDYRKPLRRGYLLLPTETAQKGIVQDLFFRAKNDREISAHIWLTDNNLVLIPDDEMGREMTRTTAYRTMLRYQAGSLAMRTAWVRDIIDYAKGDLSRPDHSVTDKFASRIEKDFMLNLGDNVNPVSIKAGGEWTHYRSRVPGYAQSPVSENRTDLFLLTRWQPTARIITSVNLRQGLVTGYNPPFTPSVGLEYGLVQKIRYDLKIKGSAGRSYRVPTLNERYWKDLGNPGIRPETGWNKEIGLEQAFRRAIGGSLRTSATFYHNRIKDWTYWNPSSGFRVENLQQVLARGIELQLNYQRQIGFWHTGLDAGYAFNKSSQEKAYDNYSQDVVGKQLVFVPEHTANVNMFFQYKLTRFTTQFQAASKRYSTSDNIQFLDGYGLVTLIGETTFRFDEFRMHLQAQIRNVTDTFYLNVRNNAMPGRSFALSLTFSYDSQ